MPEGVQGVSHKCIEHRSYWKPRKIRLEEILAGHFGNVLTGSDDESYDSYNERAFC